jgi:hypothetical protein
VNLQITQILHAMEERFTSGNSVPVERAHIRRDEWYALVAELTKLNWVNTYDVVAYNASWVVTVTTHPRTIFRLQKKQSYTQNFSARI